ncbi:MAG: ankyrin repeat domain-containing protein [Rickettsia endosymbiont of Argas persicus]
MFSTNSKGLLLFARYNYQRSVKEILKDKTDIIDSNLQDKTGKTALHWAVININFFIVQSILENKNDNIIKPDINIKDKNGCTVLHYLALTIHNLKFTSTEGSFYKSDNYAILEILFKYNINLDIQDNKGNTALHYAMSKHNFFLIEELLDKHANPFILNKSFSSILDNLNITNCNLKNTIIESLCFKYPNFIELLQYIKNITILSYTLSHLKNENNIIFENQTLLGDNEIFQDIDEI